VDPDGEGVAADGFAVEVVTTASDVKSVEESGRSAKTDYSLDDESNVVVTRKVDG
jgi:hypothetical protein